MKNDKSNCVFALTLAAGIGVENKHVLNQFIFMKERAEHTQEQEKSVSRCCKSETMRENINRNVPVPKRIERIFRLEVWAKWSESIAPMKYLTRYVHYIPIKCFDEWASKIDSRRLFWSKLNCTTIIRFRKLSA